MRLGELLVAHHMVQPDAVHAAIERQKKVGGTLGENLIALGLLTPEQLQGTLNFRPPAPRTIAETGLDNSFLMGLLLKCLYVRGFDLPSRLSAEMKLPVGIITGLLEQAKLRALVDALGYANPHSISEIRYSLTGQGREWAVEALRQSQYVGAAPVPLAAYNAQMQRQRITHERIDHAMLTDSLQHLTLPEHLVRRLGPAVNSGATMLLYGPPGNGKTSIALALANAFRQHIFVPHAIEVDGQVIKIFDSTVHTPVQPEHVEVGDEYAAIQLNRGHDSRWECCRRPVVVTGGELMLTMLDLRFDQHTRFYEAPMQLKANAGVLVLDDFGRQTFSPKQFFGRLIVPFERRVDFLTLHTGKQFAVPFEPLVVLSTNLSPETLMDDATMRRFLHKIAILPPDREAYITILQRVCELHGITIDDDVVDYLFSELYGIVRAPAAFHPKFLVEHAIAACRFKGVPVALTKEALKEAFYDLYTID